MPRRETKRRQFVIFAFEMEWRTELPLRATADQAWRAIGPLGWWGHGSTADGAIENCEVHARRLAERYRLGQDLGPVAEETYRLIVWGGVQKLIVAPLGYSP